MLRAGIVVFLLFVPVAHAQVEAVEEGVREQSCRALAASTVGIPDEFAADPVLDLPWPPVPAGTLPAEVPLRTATETFNRIYEFATRAGALYARRRDAGDVWREVPLPACFGGRVAAIAVDDDELVALDTARHVYTMDGALKDAALWSWSGRWGTPFWTGPGIALPETVAWSWSVISKVEDGSWTDPAGNRTAIGDGKVSHVWGLRPGGQRLTFWDPWLAPDDSYEACGPLRGRFRAVNLSASGSELFVIGARGDLFTRMYDFDISGHDPVFFRYAYDDQRGKGDGAPIQLPAEPWTRQPKIPGEITSAISIHKVGRDAIHRILRVAGREAGRTGYWERDVASAAADGWTFRATGLPLGAPLVRNPSGPTAELDLGRGEEHRYVMDGGELRDFSVYCSPASLVLREGDGTTRELTLHHVDGLRQQARGRGLDDTPRVQPGAIEGPRGRFETVTVEATQSAIRIVEKGWTFRRAGDVPLTAADCLPARLPVSRRGVGPVSLGTPGVGWLVDLPALRRAGERVLRWCVAGGGSVGVVRAGGRTVLLRTTAPDHTLRGIHPGSSFRALRRAFPRWRRLGRGLVLLGDRVVATVARGRVRSLAVASRATVRSPSLLHARLRDAARRAG